MCRDILMCAVLHLGGVFDGPANPHVVKCSLKFDITWISDCILSSAQTGGTITENIHTHQVKTNNCFFKYTEQHIGSTTLNHSTLLALTYGAETNETRMSSY